MKKIGIYVIIFILVILLRENIAFFYGNILGVFKLDNDYYKSIINLKDEKIKMLESEYKNYDKFSKNINLLDYNYLISKIHYKETYSGDIYKIQYGKNNNVISGLGVTNEYGLIGIITSVGKKSSELSTIRNLKDLSVKVNESYGKLNYINNEFVISDISNHDKVYVNDKVYTSGYGSIKESLYIGKVIKVENDDISKKVYVKSDVDFNNLNYILIVGDFN